MQQENNLAKALATTSAMLVDALASRDLYLETSIRRGVDIDTLKAEMDKLKAENAKLRSDLTFTESELKNAKAALKARDKIAAEVAKDEVPFTPEEG